MSRVPVGSIQAIVRIRRDVRASEADGAEFIGYWTDAILSDLSAQWNAATPDRIHDAMPPLARAARRWFKRAWREARGTPRTRHEIVSFDLRVWSQPDQRGHVLAEADVLTGTYHVTRGGA